MAVAVEVHGAVGGGGLVHLHDTEAVRGLGVLNWTHLEIDNDHESF